jgi:hypothetical protein
MITAPTQIWGQFNSEGPKTGAIPSPEPGIPKDHSWSLNTRLYLEERKPAEVSKNLTGTGKQGRLHLRPLQVPGYPLDVRQPVVPR